jgi:hypothetical protein
MPIELIWLVPDKILLSRWIGTITNDDITILMDELRVVLDNADRLVHTIIDLSESTAISPDVIYLYVQSQIPSHVNRGRIGLIGASFQSEALADLLNRISQREMVRLFSTRTAARDFLSRNDTPPPVLRFNLKDILDRPDQSLNE